MKTGCCGLTATSLLYLPPDLIQHLLSADGEDVVAPSCLSMGYGVNPVTVVHDLNTWRETQRSLQFLAIQDPDA